MAIRKPLVIGTGNDVAELDASDVLSTIASTIVDGDLTHSPSGDAVFDAMALKLNASAYTAADVLAKILTVDGVGSGLDAALLAGQSPGYYNNAANLTGIVPSASIAQAGVTQHQAALSINYSQLTGTQPPIFLTDVYTVASQAAQLALVVEKGDIAIRSDLNKSFAHNGGTAGTMADWSELLSPTGSVISVFGRTGAVTAQANDYSFSQLAGIPTTLAGYGITGTLADFNAALTGADFATGGGTATGTNTGDQTSIVGITGTKAQFDTALTDGNFLFVGDPSVGDIVGPASSVDNTFALFNGVTGKLIKQASNMTQDANGVLLMSNGTSILAGLLPTTHRFVSATDAAATSGFTGISAQAGATTRTVFNAIRARGTLASPTAPSSGDYILGIIATTWDGAAQQATGVIEFIVDGAVSAGVAPCRIGFFTSATTGAARAEKASLFSDGNFSVGSTTNSGHAFQVTGTSRFTGQITSTLATGTAPFVVASTTLVTNLNADLLDGKNTGTSGNVVGLLDGNNTYSGTSLFSNTVGIGAAPAAGGQFRVQRNFTGGTSISLATFDSQIQSDVTSDANYNRTTASTAAAAFTLNNLRHFVATQGTFGA
ncbi:MAG: hypothetical protein ABIR46_00770, partial [Candidatus Saccharimonadales bacterium]